MGVVAIVSDDKMTARAVMKELEEILRVVATAGSPSRPAAVRYTQCRDAMLAGDARASVPGFIVQCVSIYKFHDFINLYDADPAARITFIQGAFNKGAVSLETKRPKDAFRDFDF